MSKGTATNLQEELLDSIIHDANKLLTLCERDMPKSNITKQRFAGIQKSALTRLGKSKNELVKSHQEFMKLIEPNCDPQLTDLVNRAKKKYEVFEEKVYQTTQMLEADWRAGNPGLNKPMDSPPLYWQLFRGSCTKFPKEVQKEITRQHDYSGDGRLYVSTLLVQWCQVRNG